MEPEDRYPRFSNVGDGCGHVLDILVAPRPSEHGVLVKLIGDVLDRLEAEPIALDLLAERDEVLEVPSPLAGQVRRVELDPANS